MGSWMAGLIVLGATLFVLGAVLYVQAVERAMLVRVERQLIDRQRRSTETFDAWMDRRVQQVRAWARRGETVDLVRALLAVEHPDPQALNAVAQQDVFRQKFAFAQGHEGLQGYFVVSPEGLSLGALGKDQTGTPNLLWRETEFVNQMRSQGAALSPLMPADIDLQNVGATLDGMPITLFIGVPMYLGGTDPAAFFIVRLPPVSLLAKQGPTRIGLGGMSYLVDRHGRLHADRSWLNVDFGQYGLDSEPFRGRRYLFARDPGYNVFREDGPRGDRSRLPLTRSAAGVQSGAPGLSLEPYRDHRGVEVVGCWGWDNKLGLGVVTEWPTSEAFAPVRDARQAVLIAATALAALAIALLTWRLQASRRSLQQALRSAEAASRAKGVFVANMSHEIRTPLNAVLGIAHLLANTPLSATQREYLRMISSSGKALLDILNDILDYSKVEAGKMELVEAPFSLSETIDTLSSIMSVNAAPKDLELVIGIEPDVPDRLFGDAQRLLQVLVNLTGNAIKFTARGEVVLRICVVAREQAVVRLRFEVRDTGIGIPAERQSRLFGAFDQGGADVARQYGGSGLGLAISRRLVELMHGEFGFSSVDGEGSTFWFVVPIGVTGAAPPSLPAAARLRRVLVVDDNAIAREFESKSVERLGWRADQAASGAEALERVCQSGYDVLLVDWRMPGLDGLETSRAVRAMVGEGAQPVIVMITAFGREQLQGSVDGEIVDAVINKPTTSSKILDAVVDADARRRGGNDHRQAAPVRALKRLQGLRVLVVEDNYINQQVARGLLEAEGAAVTTSDHGAAAVDLLRRQPRAFDAVLMDVQMPLLDGLQASRRIRGELQLAVAIFAMSAGVTADERAECHAAGMNGFIAKPLDPQTVVHALRGRLDPPAPPPAMPAVVPAAIEGLAMPALAAALNGDQGAVLRLLGGLRDECDRLVRGLDAAVATQRAEDAALLLHTFKGVAANMRAAPLAGATERIETRLKSGGIAAFAAEYPAFRDEVLRLRARVDTTLAGVPAR